jgi:hypothetical protein
MRHALTLCLCLLAPPVLLAESADPEADPWCDDLEPGLAGGVTCVLPSGDEKLLHFDYAPGDRGFLLTIRQLSHDGELLAETETPLEIGEVTLAPDLRDVTEDGIAELFIPTATGMANVVHAIWMADGSGIFRPIGEIASFGVPTLEVTDGLLMTATRTNAARYEETALRVGTTRLTTAYSLTVDHAERSCTLTRGEAFAAAGRSAEDIVADCEAREWD